MTNATVHNVLKKFRVTVAKTDRETGTQQGDATLAGAVYGIYDGDTLIDTYTTCLLYTSEDRGDRRELKDQKI